MAADMSASNTEKLWAVHRQLQSRVNFYSYLLQEGLTTKELARKELTVWMAIARDYVSKVEAEDGASP